VLQVGDVQQSVHILEETMAILGGPSAGRSSLMSLLAAQPAITVAPAQGQVTALLHQLDQAFRLEALLNARPAQQAESPLSPADVMAEYVASLERCAASEADAANDNTAAKAAAVCQEFISWLAARQQGRGVTLQTCTPVDIKVFFESRWLRQQEWHRNK